MDSKIGVCAVRQLLSHEYRPPRRVVPVPVDIPNALDRIDVTTRNGGGRRICGICARTLVTIGPSSSITEGNGPTGSRPAHSSEDE